MTATRARACAGKQRHPDRSAAENHRFGLIRKGAYRSEIVAYKCRFCGWWHVGHRMRGAR